MVGLVTSLVPGTSVTMVISGPTRESNVSEGSHLWRATRKGFLSH